MLPETHLRSHKSTSNLLLWFIIYTSKTLGLRQKGRMRESTNIDWFVLLDFSFNESFQRDRSNKLWYLTSLHWKHSLSCHHLQLCRLWRRLWRDHPSVSLIKLHCAIWMHSYLRKFHFYLRKIHYLKNIQLKNVSNGFLPICQNVRNK